MAEFTRDAEWTEIARTWLKNQGVTSYLSRAAETMGDQLQAAAEEFFENDLGQLQQDGDDAAYDAHIERQIDEARES